MSYIYMEETEKKDLGGEKETKHNDVLEINVHDNIAGKSVGPGQK
jgi:hypothetical protein